MALSTCCLSIQQFPVSRLVHPADTLCDAHQVGLKTPRRFCLRQFRKASKKLRALILNVFCQVCAYNRKYAIRLLNGPAPQKPTSVHKTRSPSYPAKVISVLAQPPACVGFHIKLTTFF